MKRTLIIAACVLPAFILVNFLEFDYWFYNNEMPAYLRGGVLAGDAHDALNVFYEASRSACHEFHPNLQAQCEAYQLALLGDARYVRPFSSAVGVLLTFLAQSIDFMQALKFAIIALAIGGAVLCGLMLSPFLAALDRRTLTAIGLVWIGGFIGTGPLHVDTPAANIAWAGFALVVALLVFRGICAGGNPSNATGDQAELGSLTKVKPALEFGLVLLATALCYWLGYRLHLIFESRFPLWYLLLAVGLWPLLNRLLSGAGSWGLAGLLSATLYLMGPLVPVAYNLSLAKQHQQLLLAVMIFISMWRNDARIFWALPLLLVFDLQNAARLCALVILAEGIVGLLRREWPTAIAPAALVAVAGTVITKMTAVYPFDERLYNFSDVLTLMQKPPVLIACFVSVVTILAVRSRLFLRSEAPVALDRLFVYAASVVAMGGIQIPTQGLLFDAFQMSNVFTGVGVAPAMAIFAAVAALSLRSDLATVSEFHKRSSIATLAALLLLMSSTRGRHVSLSQLGEGIRASISWYLPSDWLRRRTPYMTLQDNVVYLDASNLMTGPLMQYSVIKILLLSRTSKFSGERPIVVLAFPQKN
jgi:hypothetical protein